METAIADGNCNAVEWCLGIMSSGYYPSNAQCHSLDPSVLDHVVNQLGQPAWPVKHTTTNGHVPGGWLVIN